MKLAECKLGAVVCINPERMHPSETDSHVIGHVVGLRKVHTGGVVPLRFGDVTRLEFPEAGKWTGPTGIVPVVQFADRAHSVVIDYRDLDLFTEF
jgi:hypothetical protein